MKKMKNIHKILLLLVAITATYSCSEDVLEIDPPGFASAEGFYKSASEVEAGINGIYQIFQGDWWGGAFVHIFPHFEAVTENAVLCCSWEYGVTAISNGTISPTSGGFQSWKWDFGYQAVTRANQIEDVILNTELDGMTDELEGQFLAEVRFLRAFVYAELSFLYGDVPLILTPIDGQEAREIVRTPKATVVDAILSDLDFAIANLETSPRNGDLGRPTLQAAIALKGKVQLYNDQFAEAASTLSDVIAMEGGAVTLDPNYESLFRGENEASSEILFGIQYVGQEAGAGEGTFIMTHYAPSGLDGTSASEGQGWGSLFYTRSLIDDYYMSDGMDIGTSPLYDENNIYDNRDPRFKMTFFTPGDDYRGQTLVAPDNFLVNGATPSLPMACKKWVTDVDVNSLSDRSSADLVLMRYADVLLMYAEAQNEAVGPDASVYDAVNKIRSRVGMPNFAAGLSQDQMRDEIRHERKIEFMMEGHRYFDLMRWRTAENVIPSIPDYENRSFDPAKNYLWPIPQGALDQSPNLTQNPGY